MNQSQKTRLRIVFAGIALSAVALAASLYSTQIIHGAGYAAKADKQYSRPATTLFDRGTIYFQLKDGTKIAAATVERGYLAYMNPKLINDPTTTYEVVSQFLQVDKKRFLDLAANKNDSYEELAGGLKSAVGQSIAALNLPGIGVVPESWRFYPGDSLAAHVLGLVGEDASSSAITGKYGLERFYQNTLGREGGFGSGADIFAELFSGVKDTVFGGRADEGDIVTTIDPAVETYLEKVLSDTEAKWHPDTIGGIVMNPENGEIVAMASHPSFNPNKLSSLKSSAVLSDPLVENVYEMGSIMKPITMSSALDAGAVGPDSTYDDTGCLKIAGYNVCNYDLRARGPGTTMQTILSQSLNVGAATIAMKMGSTTMYDYFKRFGLFGKSGIDLPNEGMPITGNLKHGADIDIVTAAFGQGIAVSPVQMARALSVIANGGYLVTPHLVKEIDYNDGKTKEVNPPRIGPVISPKTANEVQTMLVNVVDKAFAPGTIAKNHYSQGAKTGTAQIADPTNGGYYPNRYLHSFFGFFPAYNAKFLIFLYQVYPKGAEYASQTLTAAYTELASFLINYYNIAPDR